MGGLERREETEMVTSVEAEYVMCDACHKAYKTPSNEPHECPAEIMTEEEIRRVHAKANIWGYKGEGIPSVCVPFSRACRLLYSYLAVPCCALFSVIAMALYGVQMLDRDRLPGIICFVWFVLFTVICCAQCALWCVVFIPARYSRENYNFILGTPLGGILRREAFYKSLQKCGYALSAVVSLECMFLVVTQYALIDHGKLNQNFGLLMGVPCLIHIAVLIVRLLAWSQETFNDIFYIEWWDFPRAATKNRGYYEYEFMMRFGFVAELYGAAEIMMIVFATTVTFALTEFDMTTDKIQQFYDTFHPCELIDHYPASLVGLFLIGIREVMGLLFTLMLMIFVYCSAGPIEVMWGMGVLSIGQLLCTGIVNAFSAQLYDKDDIGRAYVGLTDEDKNNVAAHTLSYLCWLVGMIILFAFQFRMMYRFKIPFGNGSLLTRVFWHVFFVIGNIFTVTMAAAMFVAITKRGMQWQYQPSSFIQIVIGFMFNKMQGKYLMLMVAPIQKRMFPYDLGIKLRVTANAARGKFGILGRSENVLTIGFWALAFLVFGTYMLQDDLYDNGTLFPIARGFREKPAVYVFAPVWFLISMVFAFAVFLKVQEVAGSGGSALRVLAIKVIGLAMVVSTLMCLFVTIPLWQDSSFVTIGLVMCFPLWFFVGQGFSPRSTLYVCSYIILIVLATAKTLDKQVNVIASVILMVQFMVYPCCFKQPNVRLYYHFEVMNQRRVVDHRQQKQYDMVPAESGGAYVNSAADYAEAESAANAAVLENERANQEAGDKQRACEKIY